MPRISIGLPIYNGEKYVKNRLDNILSQTFQDFEIIIYDNSNDSTPKICREYAQNDDRIDYVHEKKRSGWIQGWINVMKKARCEFFVIAAVDDLWSVNYLEENIIELEKNPSAVASNGIEELIGDKLANFTDENPNTGKLMKFVQKCFRTTRSPDLEAKGTFQEKATLLLRKTQYRHDNGLIRTSILKKCIIKHDMFLWDWAFVLSLTKYGDLHIAKKATFFVGIVDSVSRKGIFELLRSQKAKKYEYLLPASSFTVWCMKNIGISFFLRNIDYFLWLNSIHIISVLSSLYLKIKS
jgi:glycosyltransferase involved in cell wall biosynthesis